jgi:large subunit ribosomal protein L4
MKADVTTLDNKNAGSVELDESIFGIAPRADILHRVVNWQLAKRRAGTHKVQTRGEVTATGAKMYRQKGTGRARHGTNTVTIFRGGAPSFGPVVRDHATNLPKKVRKLGLRMALSAKQADGKLTVLDAAALTEGKTGPLAKQLAALGLQSALIIDGPELDTNMVRAASNIPQIDLLADVGANVYDILKRDRLVLTKSAITRLEERLK